MSTKDEDFVEHLHIASAHSSVLVFTEDGQLHALKVHQLPELGPASRGKAMVNLLQLEGEQRVATTLAIREFSEDEYLVFATERGVVKRTALSAYANVRAGGIIAINVDEGDRLLAVRVTDGSRDVFLATSRGYSIRFPEADARAIGRATRGVRGISLRGDDEVVAAESLDPTGALLTISENGYGKRTALDEYRRQGRGGMGIINLKVSKKTGRVVAVRQVADHDQVMLITHSGKIIRLAVDDVSLIGRATQGVRVMDLAEDDRIVAVARIPDRDEEGIDAVVEAIAEDPEPSGNDPVH